MKDFAPAALKSEGPPLRSVCRVPGDDGLPSDDPLLAADLQVLLLLQTQVLNPGLARWTRFFGHHQPGRRGR